MKKLLFILGLFVISLTAIGQSWDAYYPYILPGNILDNDSVQFLSIQAEDDSTFTVLVSDLFEAFGIEDISDTTVVHIARILALEAATSLNTAKETNTDTQDLGVTGNNITLTDGGTADVSSTTAVGLNTAKLTNATHSGEVTGSGVLTIANSIIEGANLEATNSAVDNYIPSWDEASGGFTWVSAAAGGGGDLLSTNNLSDLADDPTAVANLGFTATVAEINTPLDGASVTLTEFQELETIGATTISAAQWAALGGGTTAGMSLWNDASTASMLTTLGVATLVSDSIDALLLAGETGVALADSTGVAEGSYVTGWDFVAGQDLKANLISPSFTTPALGTPSAGVMTNMTGLVEAGLDATNAPTDNYILSFDDATDNFTWVVDATGGTPATADISDVSVTQTELAELETIGATTIAAEQWSMLGSVPTTVTGVEVGYVDGVTSAIQTQLNTKQSANYTNINAETGTTYTFVIADDDEYTTLTNASAITVTIPPNSSVAFPVGATIDCEQAGAGAVTFSTADGVVTLEAFDSDTVSAGAGAVFTLIKKAENTWRLTGNL